MTKCHAVAGGTALLVIAFLFYLWSPKADPLEEAIRVLQLSTTTPGATISKVLPFERGPSSLECSWELSTSMGWEDYRAALQRAMPKGYELEESGELDCTFVMYLPADTLRLRVEVDRGSPLRLGARFRAQPW